MKLSAAGAFFFLVAAVGLLHAGKPSEDRWLQRSKRENISAFEKAAYEQLAKMHLCKFSQHDHRGCFQVIGLEDNQGPTEVIYRMGLDTLPILVEALDDETPTKTVTWDRGGEHPVWKVNELVARLIHWVADRDFEIKSLSQNLA